MLTVRSLSDVLHNPKSIVTVGTFDGVHRGHQQILTTLHDHARMKYARSVVVTFDPHPREVVHRGPVQLLTTIDERIAMLGRMEIDLLLVLQFTFEFSRQTPREFYEKYIVRGIGAETVVVGHDHMFGRDREAGVEELQMMGKEFGFAVHEVAPLALNDEIVSSSKIRELLLRGDVSKAGKWLGRPYTFSGRVVRGDGRGAALGFPTANINPFEEKKLVPAEGIYFVEVDYEGKTFFGMLNIGVNPTFKNDGKRTIEVNIFNFHENVYAKTLNIHFIRRLRGEQKFATAEALVEQMHRDQEQCMKLIETYEHSI